MGSGLCSVLFIGLFDGDKDGDKVNGTVGPRFTDETLAVNCLDHDALLEFDVGRELGEAIKGIVHEAIYNAN